MSDSEGWSSLQEIYDESLQIADDERNRPPIACPNDGTPLVEKDGILWCSFDGWTWRG